MIRPIALLLVSMLACSACQPRPETTSPAQATVAEQSAACPAAQPSLRTDVGWLNRHHGIVENARKGGHEIAFIGDSITQQWASAGKDVWAADWAPRKAVNCGIGGDRTQHIIGRLDDGLFDALTGDNNDIRTVVLLIGTNNTSEPADSAADIATGISVIVKSVRSRLPRARVILMNVFPRGTRPNAQRYMIEDINARIAHLSRDKRVTILDIGPKFLTPEGEIPKDLMPDALHLSPAAYQIWSDALKAELDRK